MIENVMV
jgi:hypothetical protein